MNSPGSPRSSQALRASQSQMQPMCGLMQRRLVTSDLHHNEEDVAPSLSRGDSVLTPVHIPTHNLLHSPTVLALRCRDQLLAKSDFDFRPCCWLGSPSTWCLTKGQRYPVHWELLLPPSRVVVERGSFFVCDKSHKRQRSALLRGARPPGRGDKS